MYTCLLCNSNISNIDKLGCLLVFCKENINKLNVQEYYNKYITPNPGCKVCGKKCKFVSVKTGWSTYCGTTCANKDPYRIQKIKKTNLEKYGSTAPLGNSEILEKLKATNRERFGSDFVLSNEIVKSKISKTINDKYGVDNVSQCQMIKDKKTESSLKKYGTEHVFQSETVKAKIRETNQERFGSDNCMQNSGVRMKALNTVNVTMYQTLFDTRLKDSCIPLFELSDFYGCKNHETKYPFKCLKCDHEWDDHLSCGRVPLCPICYPINHTSLQEIELLNFIKELIPGLNIVERSKHIIPPKEIDIYLPELKLAIEYNGLYWHSHSRLQDKNYHLNKTKSCKEQDIQLIHIFEDEWVFKKDIVKSRLSALCGVNSKIYARQCDIRIISNDEKNTFLERNHILGKDVSSIRLGAFYLNEMVAIMTFSKPNIAKGGSNETGVYELNRFCSKLNTNVVGAASKLFKYFLKNYKHTKIFSYSDNRWGSGSVYEKMGFKKQRETVPGYWYVDGYNRIHRYNFRKSNLKKMNSYKDELSEKDIMTIEGYELIYDCGNTVFIFE